MWQGDLTDNLSRLDKLGATLIGGVVSGFLVITLVRLSGMSALSLVDLRDVYLFDFGVMMFVQTGVALLLGVITGEVYKSKISDTDGRIGRRIQPWNYLTEQIENSDVVIKTDSESIRGTVAGSESRDDKEALLIAPVDKKDREELGKGAENPVTNAAYISETQILEVHFFDEKDDSEYAATLPKGDAEPPEDDAKK